MMTSIIVEIKKEMIKLKTVLESSMKTDAGIKHANNNDDDYPMLRPHRSG